MIWRVFATWSLLAGLALCASGRPQVAAQLAASSRSPAAIPGYWLVQRLGTPDRGFFFADANHGWGLSSQAPDAVFRTTNGGASWQVTTLGADYDWRTVKAIFFLNSLEGWVTGARTYYDLPGSIFIAHTSDGGATWIDQTGVSRGYYSWVGGSWIWFVDALHGWAQDGYLWRTTDGGHTWSRLEPTNMPARLLRFISPTVGFGLSGTTLLRSADGGATWTAIAVVPGWTQALWLHSNGLTMWAVGTGGQIARSTDGGVHWDPQISGTTRTLNQVRFCDATRGWATGEQGTVLRTTDGGLHWQPAGPSTGLDISALAAVSGDRAWVYAGTLWRTRNGGTAWSPLPQVGAEPLRTVAMGTATDGWAGGAYSNLLHTANRGRTWTDQDRAAGGILTVDAVDAQRAWALSAAYLQRTTDRGATWITITLPVREARDVDFVNANNGWLVAQATEVISPCTEYDEQIYFTTDGGYTWTPQITAPAAWRCQGTRLERVSFADALHGWVLGRTAGKRLLLRTTDGGATWTVANWYDWAGECQWYYNWDISFADANHGWAIDGGSTPFPICLWFSSGILRTTDGGPNLRAIRWGEDNHEIYQGIDFLNSQEGWVVGNGGLILHTTDGGDTWEKMNHPLGLDFYAVDAAAPGLAWIVGAGGIIVHYSATEPPGCWATPTPLPTYTGIPPATAVIQRQIAHCMDDTYVRVDTEELLYDQDLVRMGARAGGAIPYVDGFLFRDVRIPQGAEIISATLRLYPWGWQSGTPIVVQIAGDARGQADDFNPANWWAHLRPRTAARVPWTITTNVTQTTESPDITAVVQEIVDQDDWQPGNNLAILVDAAPGNQQYVDWRAYDFVPADAAVLSVSYRVLATPTPTPTPSPTNTVTPTPTPSPTNTMTPTPTRTATPSIKAYLPLIIAD